MKRFLSILLAILMLAVMLPVTAMADDANYCTIEGVNGQFDTLTAAAKAWRESKGIATTGGNMGGHPDDLTSVDSISWVISGSVGTGDGTGVVGTSGSLLSGGYIYPSIAINNVYIRGVNNAELKNELGSNDYALTAGGKNVVYDGITFPEYVSFNFGAENVTFKNCTFKGGLKVMQAINVTVVNCKFEGDGSKDFAFFAQSVPADSMEAVQFKNNTVSSFMRGINVQAGTSATVSITGNTITNLTGYTKNDQTCGAAIQLTTGREFIITNNKIDVNTGNAFRFYSGLDADVTISDNIIKAPYLVWNQAELPNEKITSHDNKLTITNPNKAATSGGALDDATVIKAAPTQIIIYPPVSSPVFLSGANQTVAPGSAATFRIDKEFSELQSVAVDGVTLDKSNYKAWSGSTYVELTASYMKTLAVGTHTLSVYFTGDTATTTFTISKDATKNPTTGANDFVGIAAAAAVVALLGSAVILRKK